MEKFTQNYLQTHILIDTDTKLLLKDSVFRNQFLYPLPLVIDRSNIFEINNNSY